MSGNVSNHVWVEDSTKPLGGYWTRQVGSSGGAVHVTDPALTMIKYTGGGYTYICEAPIGSARSDNVWRVLRITDATGDAVYAGTGLFEHDATDSTAVAGLTYTLGP